MNIYIFLLSNNVQTDSTHFWLNFLRIKHLYVLATKEFETR